MFTKKLLWSLLCLLAANAVSAQRAQFFKPIPTEKIFQAENVSSLVLPYKFDAYTLDEAGVRAVLESAPWESTPEAAQRRCVVKIPIGSGQVEEFSVWRTAMLDAALAEACPYIRTYAGISLQNPSRTVRFSTTLRGFRALLMHPDFSASMVKPIFPGQSSDLYIAYNFEDSADKSQQGFQTGIAPNGEVWFGERQDQYAPPAEDRGQELTPVRLKVYRFCVAAVGQFTQDHGGTKPLALSAVTEYTNAVSGVFERDIDVRLQLTAATQYVIFTDPNTDPYFGPDNAGYMSENPGVLNEYTNFNSHDVGHVFIRGGGGVAGALGNACGPNKAEGCSAGFGVGDYGPGFLYVVGQEVGHQLGGGHTWSHCGPGLNAQRQGLTAFEPGSGSTIMSYAGGCGDDNIQFGADLYYHGGSIEEIKTYTTFIGTCGSWQEKPNNVPEVSLPYQDNFSIPISTPFELNGVATDPDGDALTFSWEGIDAGPETPLGQPQGNTAIFRSWPAVTTTKRVFPRLSTILANQFNPAEQLPTYTRDLTFRFTARDNKPDGGGVAWADVAFKAVEVAGPFLVVSPNTTSEIWRVGELTEVKWDVANTDKAPVNCQKVNILLSTNGGQTFPTVLAANTENDGSQYILVPNMLSSSARIRVEAADNVFFDLSNANFKIQDPIQPSLTLGLSTNGGTICLPDIFSTDILTAAVLGYNTPVALDVVGNLPPGATAMLSTTTLNPGENATLTVNLESVAVEGSFSFNIRAISGTDTLLRPVSLLLRRNDFTGFALELPVNGATNLTLAQTLHWNKGLDADTYDVQFSDSPSFANILASATSTALDSFKVNFLLEKGKAYFWRVRPRNECGIHAWSEPFFFSTYAELCLSFTANDLPKAISTNGTPTIESKITVVQGGSISDLVISQIDGFHEYFKDLEAHLISPQGTDILLWKDRCSNYNGAFKFGFSDAAPISFTCPPPTNGTFERPQTPLAPIIGQNSTGVWTLRVKDNESTAGGVISNFALQFCQSVNIQPPFLVNNVVMPLPSGTNRVITPDFLLVEDPNNTHAQLVFTVMTVPERGLIAKDGFGELKPGDQFTQADIDAGALRFFDYGISPDPDGFKFMVSDGEGGFFGTPYFVAQPLVGTNDIGNQKLDFSVYPNPASHSVWVAFGQAMEFEARVNIFNTAGQLVWSGKTAAGQDRLHIEIGSLPKGMYALRVDTKAGAGVRKLVVE